MTQILEEKIQHLHNFKNEDSNNVEKSVNKPGI